MRIGIGYDVHAFAENRKLILGGVDIPFEKGLLGHSDADVLTHAVIDALLGAAGLGDIGRLFPDSDVAYKDISSLSLLRRAGEIIEEKGYRIGNIDAVVIMQKPKIAAYIEIMEKNLSMALGILPEDRLINVKATTEEGLGFTGRSEGIAAKAVCLLEK
ncbi:MAG: 2-C-methyl-D-erythritol 2,4-cyclodiphosphate synthase [Clostridiales bacterium]|jgi:2-C-methyl-D-erythritol 2,4-cyclodiphosphate synthase|nr:2-C-methyl-D-erythritol 2,4-cyclodiphosphate synthase [Clostridiales bacterium]